MNYILIRYDEKGCVLPYPNKIDVSGPSFKHQEIKMDDGDILCEHQVPILKTLNDLKNDPFFTNLSGWGPKFRNLESFFSLRDATPPIWILKHLRYNGYCTPDFHFPDEVQHVIVSYEQ